MGALGRLLRPHDCAPVSAGWAKAAEGLTRDGRLKLSCEAAKLQRLRQTRTVPVQRLNLDRAALITNLLESRGRYCSPRIDASSSMIEITGTWAKSGLPSA